MTGTDEKNELKNGMSGQLKTIASENHRRHTKAIKEFKSGYKENINCNGVVQEGFVI